MTGSFRVGTRGSALAIVQATAVAKTLSERSGLDHALVRISTEGDRSTGSLTQMGGMGVFTAALREALLDDVCDVAVHSLKDLPTAEADGLMIAAIPRREDPRDALCARDGLTLSTLPVGARVGTGSPRRAAQLRMARPDLVIVDIRGNVDTRLGRVAGAVEIEPIAGRRADLDAVVVAAAGVNRLALADRVTELLDPAVMLPAPGQGALAVECRSDAGGTRLADALAAIDDGETRLAVTAERALLARLEAGCSSPVGALARVDVSGTSIEAVVSSHDGAKSLRRRLAATGTTVATARRIGQELADALLDAGAANLIDVVGSASSLEPR